MNNLNNYLFTKCFKRDKTLLLQIISLKITIQKTESL